MCPFLRLSWRWAKAAGRDPARLRTSSRIDRLSLERWIVTTMAAGKSRGKLLARNASASTPPADAPMARMSRLAMGKVVLLVSRPNVPALGVVPSHGATVCGGQTSLRSICSARSDFPGIGLTMSDETNHEAFDEPVIVAMGASAGGIRALQTFFGSIPPDTGAAYVVVVHLDPERRSELANILATRTKMPVVQDRKSTR